MAPFGYSLWLWFKNEPIAQGVAIAVGLWIAFRLWLARKIRREREDATEEAVEDVVKQIQEQTNERVEEAREAAMSTDDLNAAELRKLRAKDPNNRSRLP
jgi:uncharacterized membrane protein YccC